MNNLASNCSGLDWPPNVMASEEISSASATSSSGAGGGGAAAAAAEGGGGGTAAAEGKGGGGDGGGAAALLTNHAALSITLVAGSFFVTLNLLLFVAIYRRRFELMARRKPTVSWPVPSQWNTNMVRLCNVELSISSSCTKLDKIEPNSIVPPPTPAFRAGYIPIPLITVRFRVETKSIIVWNHS